jgi:pSer/pThr/pTyr-binding forkhead associated (FHA) protein
LPNGEKIEALLNQPEIEIGKAPHNKLILNDPTVSSTHAIVLVRDGGYSIVDLGSSNGTFINENRQGGEAYTLQHGDKIQLGNVMLTFRNPAETTENKTARLSLEALEEVRRRASLRSDPAHSFPRTDPSINALPPSKVTTAAEDDDAEKAERKKKKKEKDKGGWNINAISRIIAQVMGAIVGGIVTILVARYALMPTNTGNNGGGSPNAAAAKITSSDKWASLPGSRIEASGVAHVPGSDLVLIVDDGQPGVVLALKLDADGYPVGVPRAIPLGVTVKNPEAITSDGAHFYVIGSLSDASWGAENAIVRFSFDAQTQTLREPPEIISDFRGFLLSKIPELKGQGDLPSAQGGLNIEGLAWDKRQDRLIVGLRSLNAALAVLIPLRLNNPKGQFTAENLALETPRIIQLQLGGQGIRDITYDTHLNSFLIISGAPEGVEKSEFKLWEWNGESLSAKVREEMTLNPKFKPEGVTAAVINGRPFLFLVGDASSYIRLDYSDVR